jgi:hypothetical protein
MAHNIKRCCRTITPKILSCALPAAKPVLLQMVSPQKREARIPRLYFDRGYALSLNNAVEATYERSSALRPFGYWTGHWLLRPGERMRKTARSGKTIRMDSNPKFNLPKALPIM